MKTIVNVDQNWGIGAKGKLLIHIPEDMKYFRAQTKGKVVIYGRKTLETFPDGKPLPYRVNIILTRNPDYRVEDAITVHSVDELMQALEGLKGQYTEDDFIVIGGDSIYRLLLNYCDTALVTRTETQMDADAWFPNLDDDPEWERTEIGETREYEGLQFHFDRYERKKAEPK